MTLALEDEMRDAQDELKLAEIITRDTVGGEVQAIAKSRLAMAGPWGCGSDKDMPTAIRKAIFSLRQELNHRKREFAGAVEKKAKRRGSDDLI
jgi:hypothetical protein